ncbi:MAG: hypothetical protein M3041_12360 [Acidobacteriota bacterium]|nr:hypothetical protein [Acidobacteriota bacterium]
MNNERKRDDNPDPITGEPGAHPVGVAGGGTGGALAGAAIGGAVAGPVGAVVGGVVGAVAGGAAGKGAAEAVNPTVEEAHWRKQSGKEFDQYAPAYRYGWEAAARNDYQGRRFDDVERDLEKNWSKARGNMKSEWKDVRDRTRDAFERVQNNMSPGVTRASEQNKSKL